MPENLDRRAYDLLRLIDVHEPIGSIRLVDLLQQHGYSIKGRTVRLMLSELDDDGLTEKIPGKGRRLTDDGRSELQRGHVSSRLEQVRERIAVLIGQVTYDPIEDTGEVVASTVDVPTAALDDAFDALDALDRLPLGPVPVAVDEAPLGRSDVARLVFPSSITLDGVLLSRGINVELQAAGVVEYHSDPDPDAVAHDGSLVTDHGGAVLRYTDAISGERSTVDTSSLLIEAGRTSVRSVLDESAVGLFVVDNREFPLTRYEEAYDLSVETRERLGGVLDIRKPREDGPFPYHKPGWEFASLTYGGIGELAISLLFETVDVETWETLSGLRPRSDFEPISAVSARLERDEER